MPIALADLIPLVVFGVALALTLMCIAITKAFFGVTSSTLGKLPVIGGWIDATGSHIEQRITHVLGAVALGLESGIGATWHMSARLVDWIGREISRHANLLALIAQSLPGVSSIANLYAALAGVAHRIHSLVAHFEGIGHDTNSRIGHVERGIGADVLPRIRGLEREVNGEIARERVRARTAERTAEREITNLWKWTRTHTLQAGTLAFTGAVAFALSRLGLDWIKCNNAKSLFKKRGCGLWSDLEKLLAAVGEVLLVVNICQVIPWIEKGFSVVAEPLITTLTGIGAGLCRKDSAPPELLPVTTLFLPAAPDATLHLP